MRRKDREVADLEGQLAILEQCPVCRVAINDPASGVPYLVPLNFGMAAGPQSLTLYFHCAPVGTKLDLLRADPNVSFEADCPGTVSGGATSCTYGMSYQSVIGRGTVRFVEGGEKLTALQALMQHYHCPDLPFERNGGTHHGFGPGRCRHDRQTPHIVLRAGPIIRGIRKKFGGY